VYTHDVHLEVKVKSVSIKLARANLKALLDQAFQGEVVVLLRRGKEVARLVPPPDRKREFPDLREFRASIRIEGRPMSAEVIRGREEERP
jgi:prevent-host-death family protein